MLLCHKIIKIILCQITDLAFLAPTVESSNEEDAESAESGMAPDSMPRGPMHWAGIFKN